MDIKAIADLAQCLLQAEERVLQAETLLKAAKENARILREETIPAVFAEAGITNFMLASGEKIAIKSEIFANVPRENKPAAAKWLIENGLGGIVKSTVKVDFQKNDFDNARQLKEELARDGYCAAAEQDFNTTSLKACLREKIAAGEPVPLDLFGARAVFTTKITKS